VALVWNERLADATPFLADYESLLKRRAMDYDKVNHTNVDAAALGAFYGPRGCTAAEFPNEQRFDLASLRGRLQSSSYAPKIGHPGHEALMAELASLFGRHAEQGQVIFRYTTKLFVGRLS